MEGGHGARDVDRVGLLDSVDLLLDVPMMFDHPSHEEIHRRIDEDVEAEPRHDGPTRLGIEDADMQRWVPVDVCLAGQFRHARFANQIPQRPTFADDIEVKPPQEVFLWIRDERGAPVALANLGTQRTLIEWGDLLRGIRIPVLQHSDLAIVGEKVIDPIR